MLFASLLLPLNKRSKTETMKKEREKEMIRLLQSIWVKVKKKKIILRNGKTLMQWNEIIEMFLVIQCYKSCAFGLRCTAFVHPVFSFVSQERENLSNILKNLGNRICNIRSTAEHTECIGWSLCSMEKPNRLKLSQHKCTAATLRDINSTPEWNSKVFSHLHDRKNAALSLAHTHAASHWWNSK